MVVVRLIVQVNLGDSVHLPCIALVNSGSLRGMEEGVPNRGGGGNEGVWSQRMKRGFLQDVIPAFKSREVLLLPDFDSVALADIDQVIS